MERMDAADENIRQVVVHNRDIPLLARIPSLMRDICALEDRRRWQRARLMSITQHISGMPGGGSARGGMEGAFAALSELDGEHEKLCIEYTRQLKQARKILLDIPNASMRTFVTMKYIDGASDVEIRRELKLSRRNFERARKCVEEAERMRDVVWREKYIVESGS